MKEKQSLPLAYFMGLASYIAAAAFLFIHPALSAAVLSLFVVICLVAPFFPGAGIFLPAIRRGGKDSSAVAITFDDGPDPHTTPFLLNLLAKRGVNATFFVIGRRAEKYPDLVADILRAGHCIGNHTYRHDVLVMARSGKILAREIDSAQEVFQRFGIRPLAFRPPAGVVNPRLGALLRRRQMMCIHYRCRGPDMGNRRIRGLSGKILKKIQAGDIVLLHDSCPNPADFKVEQWLGEIEQILDGISGKRIAVVPLPALIRRPVMAQEGGKDYPAGSGFASINSSSSRYSRNP